MLTGQLNLHPRAAMDFLGGEDQENYVAFYDSVVEEE
jgi:hypothetical protein